LVDPILAESPDLLSLLRTGEAPAEIRRFAARGVIPLEADDRLRALLLVLDDPDADISGLAAGTFQETPPEELTRFLDRSGPSGIEIDAVARNSEDAFVLERVIRHRNVADETLLRLARTVTGSPQDALVVNQARLLRLPALIDALYENADLTQESRRRLGEIREEFFEKEVRRRQAEERLRQEEAERARAEEAAALEVETAPEPEAPAGEELDPRTLNAAHRRIAVMTVQEKINLAYSGGKEERRILVGDSNSLVGLAVLKSRGLTSNEVETFCAMRHLDDEIFRKIAQNREWMRRPAVAQALVRNPSVPLAIALPLVKHLGARELKVVMNDPNLAEGVRVTARKLVLDKRR